MMLLRFWIPILILCVMGTPAFAGLIYQNFEPYNGTPHKYTDAAKPEYGWHFNGAVGGLSVGEEPVHGGKYSWSSTVPEGEHVVSGTGIPSQIQTYRMNFVPSCHDRLTFWVWSHSSSIGEHNVMVKFFDHGKYYRDGIGIWTKDNARYEDWSQLTVLFNQLPEDFDLEHMDKIEFFNYWDGTYYYDDIEVRSGFAPEEDLACLQQEYVLVCPLKLPAEREAISRDSSTDAVLGLTAESGCITTFGAKGHLAVDYLRMKNKRSLENSTELP